MLQAVDPRCDHGGVDGVHLVSGSLWWGGWVFEGVLNTLVPCASNPPKTPFGKPVLLFGGFSPRFSGAFFLYAPSVSKVTKQK